MGRKRPHVRNPEGGACPGCEDELKSTGGGKYVPEHALIGAAWDFNVRRPEGQSLMGNPGPALVAMSLCFFAGFALLLWVLT